MCLSEGFSIPNCQISNELRYLKLGNCILQVLLVTRQTILINSMLEESPENITVTEFVALMSDIVQFSVMFVKSIPSSSPNSCYGIEISPAPKRSNRYFVERCRQIITHVRKAVIAVNTLDESSS